MGLRSGVTVALAEYSTLILSGSTASGGAQDAFHPALNNALEGREGVRTLPRGRFAHIDPIDELGASGEVQAGAVSGDPVACAAQDAGGALVTSVDGTSLTSSDNAALAASCYFVAMPVFEGGCGSQDLWIMRYLCYTKQKGWYYVNYFFCRD